MKDFKLTSIRNWEITRNVAAVVGALTSITVIFTIVYFNVLDASGSKFLSFLVALASVAGALFVIDWGLLNDLPYAFQLLISGKFWGNWKISAFLVLLLGFNVVRSFTTITLSWQGRRDMVHAVMGDPDTKDVAQVKATMDATTSDKLDRLERQIADLEKSVAETEKRVASENQQLVKLVASGNSWASRELQKRKDKATWKDRSALESKRKAYDQVIEGETAAAALVIQETAKQNKETVSFYESVSGRNMAYIGYFGAGCTFVVILISMMLALINVAEQELPEYQKKYAVNIRPTDVAPVAADASDVDRATMIRTVERVNDIERQLIEKYERQKEEKAKRQDATGRDKVSDSDKRQTPEVLSDNGSSLRQSKQATGRDSDKRQDATTGDKTKTVARVAREETTKYVDVKKLIDRVRKQWRRAHDSDSSPEARQRNKEKAQEGINELLDMGFIVKKDGAKLEINSPEN